MTEKYSLRLIELPTAEACKINTRQSQTPYIIKLALHPPRTLLESLESLEYSTSFTKLPKFYFQEAIVKKFDFVLDLEAAENFPPSMEVEYLWGKPEYEHTQYVSRDGIMLAQIINKNGLLLLLNRLYKDRSAATNRIAIQETEGRYNGRDKKPNSHVRNLASANDFARSSSHEIRADPEPSLKLRKIRNDIEAFCSDARALQEFYYEISQVLF